MRPHELGEWASVSSLDGRAAGPKQTAVSYCNRVKTTVLVRDAYGELDPFKILSPIVRKVPILPIAGLLFLAV